MEMSLKTYIQYLQERACPSQILEVCMHDRTFPAGTLKFRLKRVKGLLKLHGKTNLSTSYTDIEEPPYFNSLIYVADAHYCATAFYSIVSVILRGFFHSQYISISAYCSVELPITYFTYYYLAAVLSADSLSHL